MSKGITIQLLEVLGGGISWVVLNVEKQKRVIKGCALRLGATVHFGTRYAKIEQGLKVVKGIATGNEMVKELPGFKAAVRGTRAKCVDPKKVAKDHPLKEAFWVA